MFSDNIGLGRSTERFSSSSIISYDHVLNKAQNYFEESIAVIEQLRQMNKYVETEHSSYEGVDHILILARLTLNIQK